MSAVTSSRLGVQWWMECAVQHMEERFHKPTLGWGGWTGLGWLQVRCSRRLVACETVVNVILDLTKWWWCGGGGGGGGKDETRRDDR